MEQFEDYYFPETRIEIIDEVEIQIKLTKLYVLQFLKSRIDEMEAPKNVTIIQPDGITKAQLDTIND